MIHFVNQTDPSNKQIPKNQAWYWNGNRSKKKTEKDCRGEKYKMATKFRIGNTFVDMHIYEKYISHAEILETLVQFIILFSNLITRYSTRFQACIKQ